MIRDAVVRGKKCKVLTLPNGYSECVFEDGSTILLLPKKSPVAGVTGTGAVPTPDRGDRSA